MPRTTGSRGSSSYIPAMPKLKRVTPVMPSTPIRALRKPSMALIRPFRARSFTMPMMMMIPIILVRNSSRGPKAVATLARGGAMNRRAMQPTTPPMKALIVVVPMAFMPSPFLVMG